MAASLLLLHQSGRNTEYYPSAPQAPPSPPMEETKCSLPSISKLLGIADAGSPTSLASPDSASHSPRHDVFPSTRRQESPFTSIHSRPGSSYTKPLYQSRALPPTPPLGTDSSFDHYVSPASKSSRQPSNPQYLAGRYMEATPPPLDTDIRRHQVPSASIQQPQRYLQTPSPQRAAPLSSFSNQPEPGRYYGSSHHGNAAPQPQPQISNLYYQQPLPQSFPPGSIPLAYGPPSAGNNDNDNPWQHHHYLNPIHGVSYPQSQDRYICPTCNKAFSRPSSLRIHSHSHTGEKPFKCPHAGCGKAFSVRSNMKRHERGCHTFNINAGRPNMR